MTKGISVLPEDDDGTILPTPPDRGFGVNIGRKSSPRPLPGLNLGAPAVHNQSASIADPDVVCAAINPP
ncbi:hypothetical protein [Rhodopseudomonas palustris]|uniref:hypothetical protein n=1 Tax=Rhodopseudomonas palustris TaxID=1076 RepID=UPI001058A554|nr:hypothetical protein [Rhodopseudomonas palustris]QLH72719.1 hypothetical protein HZF03_18730 [Rhodopseudomonas palustris]